MTDQPVQVIRNDTGEIVVRPLREQSSNITPEFVKTGDDFIDEYNDVLNGPSKAMIYLTVEQVLFIHHQVVNRFGGLPGVRDLGSLESAVFRAQTTVFENDAYPTVIDKAAAMLQWKSQYPIASLNPNNSTKAT